MACKRAERDAVPVRAQQGLSGGIASYGGSGKLRDEFSDRTVPVSMPDFDEDGVSREELRVGADAIDRVLCVIT